MGFFDKFKWKKVVLAAPIAAFLAISSGNSKAQDFELQTGGVQVQKVSYNKNLGNNFNIVELGKNALNNGHNNYYVFKQNGNYLKNSSGEIIQIFNVTEARMFALNFDKKSGPVEIIKYNISGKILI